MSSISFNHGLMTTLPAIQAAVQNFEKNAANQQKDQITQIYQNIRQSIASLNSSYLHPNSPAIRAECQEDCLALFALEHKVTQLYQQCIQGTETEKQAPIVPANTPFPVGQWTGFQGKNNSCGISSILYAMFGTTKAFDWLLSDHDPRLKQDAKAKEVQKELRAVVERYRKDGYVQYEHTDALRHMLTKKGNHEGKEIDLDEICEMLFCYLVKADRAKGFRIQIWPRNELLESLKYNNRAEDIHLSPETNVQSLLDFVHDHCDGKAGIELIKNEIVLFMPTDSKRGPAFRGIIPNQEIVWRDPKDQSKQIKMRLVSYITIGSYDPASNQWARGHFQAFSFDPKGDGYHFDCMATAEYFNQRTREELIKAVDDQGNPILDDEGNQIEYTETFIEEDQTTNPIVKHLPNFSEALQNYKVIPLEHASKVQELPPSQQAARQSVHNLYACFYQRIEESDAGANGAASSVPLRQPAIQQAASIASPARSTPTHATVFVECDAGWGNRLEIRGEGIDGLSWEKGPRLECVGDGSSWMIPCSSKDLTKAQFKIVKAREDGEGEVVWETLKGNRSFDLSGNSPMIQPRFTSK